LALGLIHAVEQADFASRAAPAGLGLEPRTSYLARRLTTCFSASGRLRLTEPNSARALLIGDARGALFNGPRPVLSQDISDFPLPLKLAREAHDPGEIAKRLKQLGIRLVVLNYVTSEFAGQQTMPDFAFRPRELARYAGFWERWAEPILPHDPYDLANGGFAFYRIRTVPGAPSPRTRYPFLPGTEALAARMPDEDRPAQIRRLYAIIQFVPRVAHFETRLGALVLEEGGYREAERLLRHGLQCGFEDAGTWGCLGLALKGQHRFAEAAAAFARASQLSPASVEFPRLRDECLETHIVPLIR
jgi:tetratricopeptide (TPR) repeat protein